MKTEKPARGPSLPKQTPSTSTESNAEIGAVIVMLGVGTAMSARSSTPVIVTMQRNRNAPRLASTPTWFIPLNSNVRLGMGTPSIGTFVSSCTHSSSSSSSAEVES